MINENKINKFIFFFENLLNSKILLIFIIINIKYYFYFFITIF